MGKTNSVSGPKKLSWSMLRLAIGALGWEQIKDNYKTKIFERGKERIALFKMGEKWKVDYFVSGKLDDSGGFSEEEFAKRLAIQMATK